MGSEGTLSLGRNNYPLADLRRPYSASKMPYYEVLCLASGKLARSELKDLLVKSCRAFMNNGGIVTRLVPLGASGTGPRELAYRIRINQVSYHTAFFYSLCAFSSPKALAEVSRIFKVDERMLRHLAIRKPLTAAVEPIPDVDRPPPSVSSADPNDPDFALQKFLEEYDREFPDGTKYIAGDVIAGQRHGGSSDRSGVDDVVASLRASSRTPKEKDNVGLAWLADLKPESEKDP